MGTVPSPACTGGLAEGKNRAARAGHFRLGRAGLILGLAALAPLAGGCHAAPAGPGQVADQQITVAAVPGFANAPLQVAVRDGLFARTTCT